MIGSKILFWIWQAPFYSTDRQGHLFWHALHVGLGLHPEAKKRYGLFPDDMASFDYVSAYSLKNFGSENWNNYLNYDQFDALIRDRLIEIFTTDLMFIAQALLVKPAVYIDTFTNHIFGPNLYLSISAMILSVTVGYFVRGHQRRDTTVSNFLPLWFLTVASCAQPLLVLPSLHYSVDTTILLSATLLYTGFAFGRLLKKNRETTG